MFIRLFAVASLAALVVASPALIALRQECGTGSIQCCQSLQKTEDARANLAKLNLDSLLDGVVGPLVGSSCSSHSVVGAANSGATCVQQPVCCNDNIFSGLISVGCSPINVYL